MLPAPPFIRSIHDELRSLFTDLGGKTTPELARPTLVPLSMDLDSNTVDGSDSWQVPAGYKFVFWQMLPICRTAVPSGETMADGGAFSAVGDMLGTGVVLDNLIAKAMNARMLLSDVDDGNPIFSNKPFALSNLMASVAGPSAGFLRAPHTVLGGHTIEVKATLKDQTHTGNTSEYGIVLVGALIREEVLRARVGASVAPLLGGGFKEFLRQAMAFGPGQARDELVTMRAVLSSTAEGSDTYAVPNQRTMAVWGVGAHIALDDLSEATAADGKLTTLGGIQSRIAAKAQQCDVGLFIRERDDLKLVQKTTNNTSMTVPLSALCPQAGGAFADFGPLPLIVGGADTFKLTAQLSEKPAAYASTEFGLVMNTTLVSA